MKKGKTMTNAWRLQKTGVNLFLVAMFSFLFYGEAKEVCMAKYKGDIGQLNGKIITVDERMVALGSEIMVNRPPVTIISKLLPIQIFIIVDNSVSMGSNGNQATDRGGARFKITRDFIDTIKARFDSMAEVGVAVFGTHLSYNPVDNEMFKKCPGYDTGAYIPLLNMKKSYPPGGVTGYNLLRTYLDTTLIGTDSNAYVDLKYVPTQPFPVGIQNQGACINAGFDAAKYAFTGSTAPKY
jgi:hypothetical protein